MLRTISIADHVKSVVSNLRSSDPRLAGPEVKDWMIDMAHRHYSTSEDYGDDSKVYEWLPEDVEENQWAYVQSCQIPDLLRSIRDLERYNQDLRRQLGEANKRVRELSSEAHGGVV